MRYPERRASSLAQSFVNQLGHGRGLHQFDRKKRTHSAADAVLAPGREDGAHEFRKRRNRCRLTREDAEHFDSPRIEREDRSRREAAEVGPVVQCRGDRLVHDAAHPRQSCQHPLPAVGRRDFKRYRACRRPGARRDVHVEGDLAVARSNPREFTEIVIPCGRIGRSKIYRDTDGANADTMGLFECDAERLAAAQPPPQHRARVARAYFAR
jgi:hypothetical protein